MKSVTRDKLAKESQWGRVPDGAKYVIYSPSGWVYDTYLDRMTALRVLNDVTVRYGEGYTVAEIV